MSRNPEVIDRLVKYIENMLPKNKKITIKPMGAFKECKHFYAILNFETESFPSLQIKCYNINNHYGPTGINIFYSWLSHEDNIREYVVKSLDILDNITFSVADGKFHKNDEKLPGTEFKELMNELWHIEEELVCCVCKEKTVSETACGHKLCILCWSTINETKPRCPMCRSKIYYLEAEEPTDSETEDDN